MIRAARSLGLLLVAVLASLLLAAQCNPQVMYPPPAGIGGTAATGVAPAATGGDASGGTGGEPLGCVCAPPSKSPRARPMAPRIVGGVESTEDYPWVASLQYADGWHFCGGSLVAPGYVLTAAHCQVATGDQVRLGSLDRTRGGELRSVAAVCTHPDYARLPAWDGAVLRLSASVPLVPLRLAAGTEDHARALGWGVTSEGGLSSPTRLREVYLPVVTLGVCLESGPTVCAGLPQGGADSCQGDSGGPLVQVGPNGWELLGIVSRGVGCARPGEYGLYARIPDEPATASYDGLDRWVRACTAEGVSW